MKHLRIHLLIKSTRKGGKIHQRERNGPFRTTHQKIQLIIRQIAFVENEHRGRMPIVVTLQKGQAFQS